MDGAHDLRRVQEDARGPQWIVQILPARLHGRGEAAVEDDDALVAEEGREGAGRHAESSTRRAPAGKRGDAGSVRPLREAIS